MNNVDKYYKNKCKKYKNNNINNVDIVDNVDDIQSTCVRHVINKKNRNVEKNKILKDIHSNVYKYVDKDINNSQSGEINFFINKIKAAVAFLS